MIEVRTLREFMSVEAIRMLYKSRAAPLGKNAAVIATLQRDGTIAVQSVMDVDAPVRVMHVAQPAVGANPNIASVRGAALVESPGSTGSEVRRMGIVAKGSAWPLIHMTLVEATGPLLEIALAVARRTIVFRMIARRAAVELAIDPRCATTRIVDGRTTVRMIG
jgi:hypothetical protein